MIALLLPFLPYILAGLAALSGFAANWWLDVTDWQTAAVFTAALLACVYVSSTSSPWSRLAVMGIVAVALYLKGGIDKETRLLVQHEEDKQAIHKFYADAGKAERDRQARVQEDVLAEAAKAKEEYDAELAALRDERDMLREAAKKDVHAARPALSLDAVRRINAIRERLRKHKGGVQLRPTAAASRKAQAGKRPSLDAKGLPRLKTATGT